MPDFDPDAQHRLDLYTLEFDERLTNAANAVAGRNRYVGIADVDYAYQLLSDRRDRRKPWVRFAEMIAHAFVGASLPGVVQEFSKIGQPPPNAPNTGLFAFWLVCGAVGLVVSAWAFNQ